VSAAADEALLGNIDLSDFDPVVRIVGEFDPEMRSVSEDMMFMDLLSPKSPKEFGPGKKPEGPEPPANRLSDRSDVSGKISMPGDRKKSSGSDAMYFSKSAMAKIEGIVHTPLV